MSTDNATSLTFVTIDDGFDGTTETAAYRQDTPQSPWVLIGVEKGDSSTHTARDIVTALGIGFRAVRNVTHLRVGGTWQQSVTDHEMTETTPVQRIETEIANLRATADRLSKAAGYSGSYDARPGMLRAEANAMQHVLDVLTSTDD